MTSEELHVTELRELALVSRAAARAILRRIEVGTSSDFRRDLDVAEEAERMAQLYDFRAELQEQALRRARGI